MSGRPVDDHTLPSSHVFLTAACGRYQKTTAVPRWMALAVAGVLGLLVPWTVGCTIYVVGHDSLIAATMRRERDLQYGFEDRIAVLQRELERTTSQSSQLERGVEAKLEALSGQAAELQRKAANVTTLAQQVTGFAPPAPGSKQAAALPQAPATEAHEKSGAPAAERAAAISQVLTGIAANQERDLSRLQAIAADRIVRYRDALSATGLSLSRFKPTDETAAGGPFVPLDMTSAKSDFDRMSLALQTTLAEAAQIKTAVGRVPFSKPLEGPPEITSPFGARLDPFLGRPALHTGVDLREEMGAPVSATAPGRVIFAGSASGYGLMVEVDHGAGLTTRYAHLSEADVSVGEAVKAGALLGRVGATGRATGPHLHYEVRIDGEPVDPMRFIVAGQHLTEKAAL